MVFQPSKQTAWLSSNPVNIKASSLVETHTVAMFLRLVSGSQRQSTLTAH